MTLKNALCSMVVWLAPAVLASVVCTVAWWSLGGLKIGDTRPGVQPWALAYGIGVLSMPFTLIGSAALGLWFRLMADRSVTFRYAFLLLFGTAAGAIVMLLLGAVQSTALITAGAAYGFVTAIFWVAAHSMIGSRSLVR
jgi:hypothetical protein